jgi:hypothetical protein
MYEYPAVLLPLGLLISPLSTLGKYYHNPRYLGDLRRDDNWSEHLEMHHHGNIQVYPGITAKSRLTIWTL